MSIDSPIVTPSSINFYLPSWPPPKDFPVVVDVSGEVVSKYGDSVWDLSVWANIPKRINFGDGPIIGNLGAVSPENADVFRMVVAWWLWGPRSVFAAATLVSQHRALKILFVVSTRHGIDVKDLSRYPALIEEVAREIAPSAKKSALTLLHALYEQRDQLGFILLDRNGLLDLVSAFPPENDVEQTAYIPPRIWAYQVRRLRAVLDDFLAYKNEIEACYNTILDIYERRYGSLAGSRNNPKRLRIADGAGAFEVLSKKFGIYELLIRWYQQTPHRKYLPLFALTNFLSLVNRAGFAYILNMSLMRVQEAWGLCVDCLHIEQDEKIGQITMLCGETTKTVRDDDARWIASSSVSIAIDAMSAIAQWRTRVKKSYGDVSAGDVIYLFQQSCEPWAIRVKARGKQSMYPSYAEVVENYPKLFDLSELRITKEDWNLAKLITPSLDESAFGIGKIWKLAWHQLRRTGSVNMQASGLVSDFSLQYQLKHDTVASSLYYGQGYSHLVLNRSAKAEYIHTMYKMMGRELAMLLSDRFQSPYGDERKQSILKLVSESDERKLFVAAREGRVAWRRTLLGGCTKSGPCEYGGIDNVARCGGGDGKAPCTDALFDQTRVPQMQKLRQTLSMQLDKAELASPLRSSLQAQLRATENALNVLKRK
ncbi:hypothetical protein [Herbaspirillum frisingense]|nr:hypothetical protein [Herbaspirillum frisingense]